MKKWIIQIKVGADVTSTIGPFESEEVADRYCRIYLEPNLNGSTFHLTDLEEPDQFVRDMLVALG